MEFLKKHTFTFILVLVFYAVEVFFILRLRIQGRTEGSKNCTASSRKAEAKVHEFPWIVFLQIDSFYEIGINELYSVTLTCGGTIIRKNWIVTAAHCFQNPKFVYKITIIAGVHNRSSLNDGAQIRRDKSFVIHADFKYNSEYKNIHEIKNDVALIELDEDFELNESVNLISIWDIRFHPLGLFVHSEIAGWGQQKPCGSDGPTETLMKANPRIILLKEDLIFTTGVGGKGDSGSPLMCRSRFSIFDSKLYFCGIYSSSIQKSLDSPNWTDLFMKVSNFSGWIDTQMFSNELRIQSLSNSRLRMALLVGKYSAIFVLEIFIPLIVVRLLLTYFKTSS